jgi:hypothetical protein
MGRLGERLVRKGVISDAHLNEALARQKSLGGRVGSILIDLRYASVVSVAQELALQGGCSPVLRREDLSLDERALQQVPRKWFEFTNVVPIRAEAGCLVLGHVHRPSVRALAEAEAQFGVRIASRPIPESLYVALQEQLGVPTLYFRRHRHPLNQPDAPFFVGAGAAMPAVIEADHGLATGRAPQPPVRRRLTERLLELGVLTAEEWAELERRKLPYGQVGSELTMQGRLDIRLLHVLLSELTGMPTVDPFFIDRRSIDNMNSLRLPSALSPRACQVYEVAPIALHDGTLMVAVTASDEGYLQEVAHYARWPVEPVIASRLFVRHQIERLRRARITTKAEVLGLPAAA